MSDHRKRTSRWINTYVEYQWSEKDQDYVLIEKRGYWYDGPMALAHDVFPVWTSEDFRWINDDGTLITGDPPTAGEASYRAAENVNPTDVTPGTELRLRFSMQETANAVNGGITAQTDGVRLQFENNTQNPGTWTTIGASGVTDVYYYDSQLTNGNAVAITDFILNYSGNENDTAGEQVDDNQSDTATTHSNDNVEYEFSIGFSSGLASGDVINFRILAPDAQTVSMSASITLAAVQINESITFQTTNSESSTYQRIATQSETFSALNAFIKNFSSGVFDNFYFGSPDKYIIDDVWKFIEAAITGSITFATQQDQQTTIQLSGLASQTLLAQLLQNQTAVKSTDTSVSLQINLDQLEANQANLVKSILFALIEDQTTFETISTEEAITLNAQVDTTFVNTMLGVASISLDTVLDYNTTVQADLVKAITYLTNLDFTVVGNTQAAIEEAITFAVNNIYTPEVSAILQNTLTFVSLLATAQQKQLLAEKAIQLLTDLQMQQSVVVGLFESINLIAQLDQIPTNTMTASKAVDLIVQAAESANAGLTIEETLLITTQLLDNYNSSKSLSLSLSFNSSLQQLQTNVLNKVALITFNKILDQTHTTQIDFTASIQLLTILSKTVIGETAGNLVELITFANNLNQINAPQVDYLESAQFIADLQTISVASRTISASTTFSNSLQQLQSVLLDKVLAISFESVLDQVNTGQIDFAALITFASILADSYIGEGSGVFVGLINFAIQMQKDQVGVSLASKGITYATALSQEGVPTKALFEALNLNIQLDQLQLEERLIQDLIQFNVFLSKVDEKQLTIRPTVNFNLEALEASTTQKNTLASILMNLDTGLAAFGSTGIPGFISFAAQQNLVTDIRLIAEGDLVLNTEFTESETNKLLGTRGITFGHLLGLATLSRTDFVALMSFGTITDLTVNGFVLEFTILLPDDRTYKVYIEDRTCQVSLENRTIKVFD